MKMANTKFRSMVPGWEGRNMKGRVYQASAAMPMLISDATGMAHCCVIINYYYYWQYWGLSSRLCVRWVGAVPLETSPQPFFALVTCLDKVLSFCLGLALNCDSPTYTS
jgi:hypothetical protein